MTIKEAEDKSTGSKKIAEIKDFFSKIGLGTENDRLKFKKLAEAPKEAEKGEGYTVNLSNNTRINNGKLE